MLMTSSGQSVRISVAQVRQAGRNTMGVKLMTLREGETIQDIAQVVAFGDEEAETALVEGTELEATTTTEAEAPSDGSTGEAS
jgi:DNA gyrase subunit A